MTQRPEPSSPQKPKPTRTPVSSAPSAWPKEVGQREDRKLRARKEGPPTVWFGFGMFGLVGWSVAIPTVAGALFGVWLDHLWPSRVSWTLTCLFVGLLWGCRQAWFWIEKESQRRSFIPPDDPLLRDDPPQTAPLHSQATTVSSKEATTVSSKEATTSPSASKEPRS